MLQKKIVILTIGTFGDLMPYIALGQELQKYSYRISIATNERHETMVKAYNLNFIPIRYGEDYKDDKIKLPSSKNSSSFFKNLKKSINHNSNLFYNDCYAAIKDCDIILYSNLGYIVPHINEKINKIIISVPLQPVNRSKYYAALNLKTPILFPKVFNYFSHLYSEQRFWQTIKSSVNTWRKNVLGLRNAPYWGVFREVYKKKQPFVLGYSEIVFPRPRDWHKNIVSLGYWCLKNDPYVISNALRDFFCTKTPIICVTLDPCSSHEFLKRIKVYENFSNITGYKVIVCLSEQLINKPLKLPSKIFIQEKYIAYSYLFKKVRFVVYHGGSGTCFRTLEAGIPSVIIPHFGDQFLWVKQMNLLGVAAKPIHFKKFDITKLLKAANELEEMGAYQKVAIIANKIKNENGVGKSAKFIDDYIKSL